MPCSLLLLAIFGAIFFGFASPQIGSVPALPPAFAPVQQVTDAEPIEYTQTVEGELTATATTAAYTFTGSAGDAVLITLDAAGDAFDTTLTLNDADGVQVAYNDDSRSTRNSQIGPFTLPATGEYTIVVSSFGGSDTGAFTLTLGTAQVQTISFNEPLVISFTETDREFFLTFDANSNDIVDVFADSSRTAQVNTNLSILDASGYTTAGNYGSSTGGSAEVIGAVLYSSGNYTLVVTALDEDQTGDVTITIVKAEATSLDDGPATLSFNINTSQLPISFTGSAGQVARLTFEVEEGSALSSLYFDLRQGDASVTNLNASNARVVIVEFEVPADGDLAGNVTGYSFETGDVDVVVTLETVGE